jgi:hypothetical protein
MVWRGTELHRRRQWEAAVTAALSSFPTDLQTTISAH